MLAVAPLTPSHSDQASCLDGWASRLVGHRGKGYGLQLSH